MNGPWLRLMSKGRGAENSGGLTRHSHALGCLRDTRGELSRVLAAWHQNSFGWHPVALRRTKCRRGSTPLEAYESWLLPGPGVIIIGDGSADFVDGALTALPHSPVLLP